MIWIPETISPIMEVYVSAERGVLSICLYGNFISFLAMRDCVTDVSSCNLLQSSALS